MPQREISSLSHPLVKHLVKLRLKRDYRYEQGRILVMGLNLIRDLASWPLKTVLLRKNFTPDFELRSEHIYQVSDEIIKKISGLSSAPPILAEIALPEPQNLSQCRSLLILNDISDPGNLGTLLRSALALGWEGAFLTQNSADPYNDKVLRVSKGASLLLPWRQGDLRDLSKILAEQNMQLYAADAHGIDIRQVELKRPLALALGNEAHGLDLALKNQAQVLAVHMPGPMESLNVASAGAILMHALLPKA